VTIFPIEFLFFKQGQLSQLSNLVSVRQCHYKHKKANFCWTIKDVINSIARWVVFLT